MGFKKIFIIAALVIVVILGVAWVVLVTYDVNRLKPRIAQLVKDATDRELTFNGDLDLKWGFPPVLTAENVSFANAPWGSRPELAKIKRLEAQVALWPLIRGHINFNELALVEPDFLLEINRAGESNVDFDPSGPDDEGQEAEIQVPPLSFDDVRIENGNFTYNDEQIGLEFDVKIDRLAAAISGFDRSFKIDLAGAFDDIPLTLKGTVGPIWAWVVPGYPLPADLTIEVGSATAKIKGGLGDPINFKNLAFAVTAEGSSVADIAKLAGLPNVPELGAFKLAARIADPAGKLAVEELDVQVGSEAVAAISLKGDVQDLLTLQGINLNLTMQGHDSANLTQWGLPELPVRGTFSVSGLIQDPEAKIYSIRDLNLTLGENRAAGKIDLNLSTPLPLLSASLASQRLALGPLNLVFEIVGPVDKPALRKLNLHIGSEKLVELKLKGTVKDLLGLQGVDLKLGVRGQNLANLEELTGHRLPLKGAFSASGDVITPDQKSLKISKLQITAGKNKIGGWVELDLKGNKPRLNATLSTPDLVSASILLPKIAGDLWVRVIDQLDPVQLSVRLEGFTENLSIEQVDLQAGTDKLLTLALNGTIRDPSAGRGIDLKFVVAGNDATNLNQFMGQPSPLQGKFAATGRVTDPEANSFKVSNLQILLGENVLTGGIDLNLIGQQPQLAAELSAEQMNLQPLSVPDIEPLTRIPDLGPLKLALNLSGSNKKIACKKLDLRLGKEELIEVHLKGAIEDFVALKGMTLDFIVRASDMANVKKLGAPDLPFQGPFNIAGRFSDPTPKVFKFSTLKAVWGDNDGKGWAELDLSKERPHLTAELLSQKLDLRPLLARDDKQISTKGQPAKTPKKKVKVFSREPFSLEGLKVMDADIKLRDNEVLFPNLALNDVKIDILLENGNLKVQPFTFTIGGGHADIRFDLRSQHKPALLAGAVKIDQLDIGPMFDQLKYKRSVEGNLDVAIELHGTGDSIAGVMPGLDGHIHMAMRNGRADIRHLALLQRYLGSNVLQLLNPFQVHSDSVPINCLVNKIEIKNGRADVKLLLDTDQTSILSAGDVNLETEVLNLGIKPTPKRRLGVTGVGSISFSLKELSQSFRLGGTLAQPSLVVDPTRTAFTIGKFYAFFLALGPAGVAAFFADVSAGKTDPCVAAFKEFERKRLSSDEPQADEESGKRRDAVQQEKDGKSGGFFKRWFGR